MVLPPVIIGSPMADPSLAIAISSIIMASPPAIGLAMASVAIIELLPMASVDIIDELAPMASPDIMALLDIASSASAGAASATSAAIETIAVVWRRACVM